MKSDWEHIGRRSPAADEMSRVPRWVTDALSWMHERDPMIFRRAEDIGKPIRLKGKTYRYAVVCNGQGGQELEFYRRKRRDRATALVVREGKVLLIRNKGRRRYALPGGPIEEREPGGDALARHLKEKTRLKVRSSYPLFKHKGSESRHRVFRVDADGKVRIRHKKLEAYVWWEGESDVPVRRSAREIISKARIELGWRIPHPKV